MLPRGGPSAAPTSTGPRADGAVEAPPTSEERRRRARVVASVGTVSVTVFDLEDRLRRATSEERAQYEGAAGRRRLVHDAMRAALLADEAVRLGLDRTPAVRRAVDEALVQALRRRDFSPPATPLPAAPSPAVPAAAPSPAVPAARRAIVLFARDRAAAEALREAAPRGDVDAWITLAASRPATVGAPHPGGDLGWIAVEPSEGEADIAPSLRTALHRLRLFEDHGVAGPPIRVGGAWAVLVLGGSRAAEEAGTADDADARGRDAAEDELAAYLGRLRAAHVGPVDETALAAVPLALPPAGGREADGTPPAVGALEGTGRGELGALPGRGSDVVPALPVTVAPEATLREVTPAGAGEAVPSTPQPVRPEGRAR